MPHRHTFLFLFLLSLLMVMKFFQLYYMHTSYMHKFRFVLACTRLCVGRIQARLASEEIHLKEDTGVQLYIKYLGSILPLKNVKMTKVLCIQKLRHADLSDEQKEYNSASTHYITTTEVYQKFNAHIRHIHSNDIDTQAHLHKEYTTLASYSLTLQTITKYL